MGNLFFRDPVKTDWEMLGIDEVEFNEMFKWAFGDDWKTCPRIELRLRWNEKHKKRFEILPTDATGETIKKIHTAWGCYLGQ